jgi:hypothetical protein
MIDLSVKSLNFIFHIGNFKSGEIWTAGITVAENGRLFQRWKSRKSVDALKRNLYWNKIYPEKKGCVYLELFNDSRSRQDDPRLGMADCEERKSFICEVFQFQSLRALAFYTVTTRSHKTGI